MRTGELIVIIHLSSSGIMSPDGSCERQVSRGDSVQTSVGQSVTIILKLMKLSPNSYCSVFMPNDIHIQVFVKDFKILYLKKKKKIHE